MTKVLLPAVLSKAETMSDRSVKLVFHTQELGSDAAELFAQIHNQGWLLFSPNDDLTQEDIPEVKAEPTDEKSPSQRLRSVLYVFWVQKGKPGTWDRFYLDQMSRLIELIKDKLTPEES